MNTIHISIIGPVGSGKSALAGEIEILCKALGLNVSWQDGESEKNMTGADWQSALELYKPSVVIHESGAPRTEHVSAEKSEQQSCRDASPPPPVLPLSDERIDKIREALVEKMLATGMLVGDDAWDPSLARAIERAHGITEPGAAAEVSDEQIIRTWLLYENQGSAGVLMFTRAILALKAGGAS